jgi:hypothetical protein
VLALALCKSRWSKAFFAGPATVGCPESGRMSQRRARVSGWSEVVEESRCDWAAADTAQPKLFASVVTPRLLVRPDEQLSPGVAPHVCCSDVGRLHCLKMFPFDLKSSQAWEYAVLSCSRVARHCWSVLWECDWAHVCWCRQLCDPGGASAVCAEI